MGSLRVGPSTLHGLGLFASEIIKKSAFLGYYDGEYWRLGDLVKQRDWARRERYTITMPDASSGQQQTSSRLPSIQLVLSPSLAPDGRPDAARHPLSVVNEPRKGTQANAVMFSHKVWPSQVEGVEAMDMPEDHTLFVSYLIACRKIAAGEEITWHYGDRYKKRQYDVGTECSTRLPQYPTSIPAEVVSWPIQQLRRQPKPQSPPSSRSKPKPKHRTKIKQVADEREL